MLRKQTISEITLFTGLRAATTINALSTEITAKR
jgi:hypothetical protein